MATKKKEIFLPFWMESNKLWCYSLPCFCVLKKKKKKVFTREFLLVAYKCTHLKVCSFQGKLENLYYQVTVLQIFASFLYGVEKL